MCYSCLESTGDAHDNTGGKCHVPDGKTETVPMETDGVCTTVQGTILIDGEPTGDLVYTRRGTDGMFIRISSLYFSYAVISTSSV